MNKVQLIGRLTRDVELRMTKNSKSVVSFSLAVDKRDKTADFFNCIAWDMTAELMNKYLHKGNKVAICGHLQTRSFETKDGRKQTVTEVVADEVEFLERKEQKEEHTDFMKINNDEKLPF